MSQCWSPIRFEKAPSVASSEWWVEEISCYLIPLRKVRVAVLTEIEEQSAFLRWEEKTQSWWTIALKIASYLVALWICPPLLLLLVWYRLMANLLITDGPFILGRDTLNHWIMCSNTLNYKAKALQLIEKLHPHELSHPSLGHTPLCCAVLFSQTQIALALIRKLPLQALRSERAKIDEMGWGVAEELRLAWLERVRYLEAQIPRQVLSIGLAQAELGHAPQSSLERLVRHPTYEPRVFSLVGHFLRESV